MLWSLFWTFLKLGFVSFGGGYAMLPVIEYEAAVHHWMSAQQYTEAVALAGMAPGPVAMNIAVYVGFTAAGLPGSLVASLGIILPSVMIMFLVATIFYRMYDNQWVQAALGGMKPAVIALVAYAAVNMAMHSEILQGYSIRTYASIVIFALSLLGLVKFRMHPITVILLSGIVGIAIYA
ncbi:chromate transporter [Paenibacillus sp. ACRRX]|uniref:chromate transporter n=1 Tax=unclassified Paenibacillus TaxID=185978 RepID=UPI001EF51E89|nr:MULTISPECIES: chromate transporter [unclassified Paenibacillus]MCG7408523.1 chromate transporter [Paenibacillus sp. ACRRX]MDK8182771.1 chromate transporter [Paenibacillus sp. UMB4589-SE434]